MEKKAHSNMYLIKKFSKYFKKYRWILIFDLVCAGFSTASDIALPLILRYMTNTALTNLSSLTMDVVTRLTLIYLGLKLVDVMASYFMTRYGHIMGAKIETDMRRDLFNHLQKLSDSYFNDTKVGQIMSRITSDLFDVTEFAHHCPEEYFIGGLKIIISFVILININIPLTLIIFAILPIMVFASTSFRARMRRGFKRQRFHIGELNAGIEDSLLGVKVVNPSPMKTGK